MPILPLLPPPQVCYTCNEGGDLLCCDGCTAAYHLACVNLDAVPQVCVGGVRAVCLRVCVCVQPPKKHLNTVVMSWEGVWEAMRVVGAGGVGGGGRNCSRQRALVRWPMVSRKSAGV